VAEQGLSKLQLTLPRAIRPSWFSGGTVLRRKVRSDDSDEVAGRDDLGLLPESWGVALVAGYQVVGAGRVT
jgi:hypothetical protein